MTTGKSNGTLITQEREGFPIVLLSGYFDEDLANLVVKKTEELLQAGKVNLIFDFTQCSAINSLAVGQLQFLTMRIVEDFRGHLLLSQLKPIMVRVFELAAITPYAEIAPNIEKAVELLKAS